MTFEREWERALPGLMRKALTLTRNRTEEAHDLLQETAIRCFRTFGSFSQERSFTNWAMRIMGNLHLDSLRHARRRPLTCPFEPSVEEDHLQFLAIQDQQMQGFESEAAVDDFLERIWPHLPTVHYTLLRFSVEDYTISEMAKRLGMREGTVRSSLGRMREKIQRLLAA